jgi:hypothetical protein
MAVVPVRELTLAMTSLQMDLERAGDDAIVDAGLRANLTAAYLACERAVLTACEPRRARFRAGAFLPAPVRIRGARPPALSWCHPRTRRLFAQWLGGLRRTSGRGTGPTECRS